MLSNKANLENTNILRGSAIYLLNYEFMSIPSTAALHRMWEEVLDPSTLLRELPSRDKLGAG